MKTPKWKIREAGEALENQEKLRERRRMAKLGIFLKHYTPSNTPVPDELRKVESLDEFKHRFFEGNP